MDGIVARSEWDHLVELQQALRAIDGGEDASGPARGAGRGVRLRLARLALEDAIRRDSADRARCRHEEFERALEGILTRVALRALSPVSPSQSPATPAPPALPVRVPGPRKVAAAPCAAAAPAPPATAPAPAAAVPLATAPAAKPKRARRPKPKAVSLPEFWSPGVVLGFRLWDLRGRLYGAWKLWERPEYEARCLSRRAGCDGGEVPHTDGRCGPPPCGLYCFKEPEQLITAFGLPSGSKRCVLGLVSLSGRVVEHERGYRAQKMRVLAAAVIGRGQIIRVEGKARLQKLFAAPEGIIGSLVSTDPAVVEEVGDPRQLAEAVIGYLALARALHEPAAD